MLKIRFIALVFALIMTAITAYVFPFIYLSVKAWLAALSPTQKQYFNYSQIVLSLLLVVWAIWHWRKKKN